MWSRRQSVDSRWPGLLGPMDKGTAERDHLEETFQIHGAFGSSNGIYWLAALEKRSIARNGIIQKIKDKSPNHSFTLFLGVANYSPSTRQLQLTWLWFQLRTAKLQRLIKNVVISFCLGRHISPACWTCMLALELLPLRGRELPCSHPCWLSLCREQALLLGKRGK